MNRPGSALETSRLARDPGSYGECACKCESEDCSCDCESEKSCTKEIQYSFRDFSVNKLNYGYVVRVGCHQFAIETPEKLIDKLTEYILDPNRCESNWWKNGKI